MHAGAERVDGAASAVDDGSSFPVLPLSLSLFTDMPSVPATPASGDDRDWRAALAVVAPVLARQGPNEAAARVLMANARWQAAEALLSEILRRDPTHLGALRTQVQVLRQVGTAEAVARMRQRASDAEAKRFGLEGADRDQAARFFAAADGSGVLPAAMPSALIARHFDLYEDYDLHLVERLGYRAPQVLADVVCRHLDPRPSSLRILDVGCGTGLSGLVFRPLASHLVGVDLSPAMAGRARERGVYDAVHCDEAAVIAAAMTGIDLVVAADVMPYVGDLAPLVAALAGCLRDGGALTFTTETMAADGVVLQGSRRFAHGRAHIRAALAAAGFGEVLLEDCAVRKERDAPVPSLAVWARRSR